VFIQEIERDDDFIKEMLQAEVAFWVNHIEANEMPAPDGSDDSMETVYTVYPEVMRDEMQMPHADGKIAKYRELGALIKSLEAQQNELKAELCYELGDAAVGVGNDFACSWKKQSRTTVDSKKLKAEYPEIYERVINKTESRVFRTKELKKKEN
jgi:predicted phage-related endonuclease